ncbi:MAG: hypothetical protein Hyperionvirus15_24 [Hyperionvirus sp.]|uniref:Uncharacterized protein n=1 Tax=Hyperionvirus sp. TaxID=2487770 RepID=A0A3G5A9N5_9VIRU|nr:MAG: hypothetical protein Hyperionvirus15_24 [Hyperionvirus sp.]
MFWKILGVLLALSYACYAARLSIEINPQTYRKVGTFNCTFDSSDIIDLEVLFIGSNNDDQIYFKTPDHKKMNFTEISIGPSDLFYGYLTYTLKNHGTHLTELPEYGLYNNNAERNIIVSYEISYKCSDKKLSLFLRG